MEISELKEIDRAPKEGHMLAYTRKHVISEDYKSIDEANNKLNLEMNGELLELHLCNKDKEYRAIKSQSKRHNGYIVHVAEFPNNGEVYEETVLLSDNNNKVDVLNKICYDENGMLTMQDYRLVF